MPQYIIIEIEIFTDVENSNKQNSDRENSGEENFIMKKILMRKNKYRT